MKFPEWMPVFGSTAYRGDCPLEGAEQATFFAQLRKAHPDTYGVLALHPKNEGKRKGAQFQQLARDKALGLSPGAADIVIPGNPALVLELKRRDHTKSTWQKGQIEYLDAARYSGCFIGVALGWEAAMQAFEQWLELQPKGKTT